MQMVNGKVTMHSTSTLVHVVLNLIIQITAVEQQHVKIKQSALFAELHMETLMAVIT